MVGLLPEQFTELHHKLVEYVETTKRLNPLRRRGRKEGKLSLEDQLLLTLYYLRHYPTFVNLGAIFGTSESYCCKVYTRTARMLVKIQPLPSWKQQLESASTLIIDVSEQPIERPTSHQKDYYSGKKTPYD